MSVPPTPEAEPKSRNWLIVVVAVVVFCCLCTMCSGFGWYLYTYGDRLLGL